MNNPGDRIKLLALACKYIGSLDESLKFRLLLFSTLHFLFPFFCLSSCSASKCQDACVLLFMAASVKLVGKIFSIVTAAVMKLLGNMILRDAGSGSHYFPKYRSSLMSMDLDETS